MNPALATRPIAGPAETVAVTGSKGGVGKSNLVLNLAVALGRWERRVLLIDGDLGLANLDVLLGLLPAKNVEHFVRGEAGLNEVLIEGPRGVRILPAASGVPALARLAPVDRRRLVEMLSECAAGADDVLIDTGAGLGESTLALQLAASRVVVVTTPEPTSLVDAYATLKVLWSADADKPIDLVVNNADDEEEGQRVYEQIARAAEHFLGKRPGSLGVVYRDPNVADAVRKQRALLELHPQTPAARCYERIALRLAAQPIPGALAGDYWERLLLGAGKELLH